MEKSVIHFRRLLRFSGLFNITAAFLFIIPHVYESYLVFYNHFNTMLGLGGKDITIPTDFFHILFINTAGIDLVLIGVIVLLVSKDPLNKTNRLIILANGIGRSFFAMIIGYYSFTEDLIQIFVAIGILDFLITLGFLYYLNKTKGLSHS